jgi:cytochrome c oxidase subunit 1
MIPLQIGAPDMALPRMNNFSFWLLVAAFSLLILSLFMPGGGPAAGWTLYPPLVLQTGDALPLAILAIHLAGASSIMRTARAAMPPGTATSADAAKPNACGPWSGRQPW